MLTLDTALVDIVSMKTAKGNRPDSVTYKDGKALLYCSFSVAPETIDIGYIDIKSKSLIDTTLSLSVENYAIVPAPIYAVTSTLNLSLQKLKLTFNITSASSASYGEQRTIPFGMQSTFTSSILLPPLSYTISLDTLGLDSIEILAANTDTRIVPDKVTAVQGKIEYVFSPPVVPSYPFVLGRLRFRSKSLKERENLISVFSSDRAIGIDYISSSIVFRQTGLTTLSLKPDFVKQLEQGQNFVKHLAPNPAADVLTVRYAMGASAENVQLELVNMLGIVMKSVNLADYTYGIHDIAVNVADIEPGIYLLRVRSNSNVEAQKVLIAR
jgi:hypothetical protein